MWDVHFVEVVDPKDKIRGPWSQTVPRTGFLDSSLRLDGIGLVQSTRPRTVVGEVEPNDPIRSIGEHSQCDERCKVSNSLTVVDEEIMVNFELILFGSSIFFEKNVGWFLLGTSTDTSSFPPVPFDCKVLNVELSFHGLERCRTYHLTYCRGV